MRRLPDEKHFARKAKWKQRRRKQKRKTDRKDATNVAAAGRGGAARCAAEFESNWTRS
jgi:hypothetical protein